MPTPTDPKKNAKDESTYVIDAESGAEMARLTHQDRLATQAMGTLFPERSNDLTGVHDILDVGCGPGGWVLDVAFEHPKVNIVGVDISQIMIEYARAHAKTQGLDNARFKVTNALKPLDFPDHSFDIVNARFLVGFVPPTLWPKLLQECRRITKPGGSIRLTETEMPLTNSPAFEKICGIGTAAFRAAGQSFSPDGRHIGITPMLRRLLLEAGYENIQETAYILNASAKAEAHLAIYQDMMLALKLVQPFVTKWQAITDDAYEELYQQMLAEMMADDFCSIWVYIRAVGEKAQL